MPLPFNRSKGTAPEEVSSTGGHKRSFLRRLAVSFSEPGCTSVRTRLHGQRALGAEVSGGLRGGPDTSDSSYTQARVNDRRDLTAGKYLPRHQRVIESRANARPIRPK